jgi:putative salt-induced outer membrane protein YdiY
MRKTTRIVVLSCLVVGLVAAATVMAADEADDAWKRGLSLGLSLTDGNSDTLSLNVGADANRAWDVHEFLSTAKFQYGETESEKTREDIKAEAQYNRIFDERWYAYGSGWGLYDKIANIDYRFLVGPGAGYYFMRNDSTLLAGEAGVSYLFEDVADVSLDTFTWRFAQRFEHALSETAKVWQRVEYLPELDDFDNYLLNGEVGAEAAMNSAISLRVVLEDRYDNIPAAGNVRNDVILNAALVYTL